MDNLNELINNDLFQTMQQELNDRIDEEEKHIQKLKEDLDILISKKYEEPNYKKIVEQYLSFEKPSRVLLLQIINYIEISQDGTIDIYYNMKRPFE